MDEALFRALFYCMKNFFPIITIFCVAFIAFFPGLSGSFYYDDYRPLSALLTVHDFQSAALYITTEISGPLGRPLSMLSFLININDWPDNIEHFLLLNVFIHALNGMLVYLLAFKIINILNKSSNRNTSIYSAFIAIAWVLLPINISAVLIPIQRMTLLSAMFVLIAINLYLWSKKYEADTPKKALRIQFYAFVICGGLAIFSKENAILLPLFCLLLDKTIYSSKNNNYKYKHLLTLLYGSTISVIALFLIYTIISSGGDYGYREFSMLERFQSQLVILTEYLRLSFFPDLFAYNPFHDNAPIVHSIFASINWLVASVFIILLMLLGFALIHKKPIISFAILWFFTAHILESTIVGLELYFEHRNYLATLGILIACAHYINIQKKPKLKKLLCFTSVVYIALLFAVNIAITNTWGKPMQAATAWFHKQKGSLRASEHLAIMLLENNEIELADNVLKQQINNCPNCKSSQVQRLLTSCVLNDHSSLNPLLSSVLADDKSEFLPGSAASVLTQLHTIIKSNHCQLITVDQLIDVNNVFLDSKLTSGKLRLPFLFNLHNLYRDKQDLKNATEYLYEAFLIQQEFSLANLLIDNLIVLQQYEKIEHVQNSLCARSTYNPWLSTQYKTECTQIMEKVSIDDI